MTDDTVVQLDGSSRSSGVDPHKEALRTGSARSLNANPVRSLPRDLPSALLVPRSHVSGQHHFATDIFIFFQVPSHSPTLRAGYTGFGLEPPRWTSLSLCTPRV
jgi:hypothetical protein